MGKVVMEMSVSLNGIGAGPNPSEEDRMGVGGERRERGRHIGGGQT